MLIDPMRVIGVVLLSCSFLKAHSAASKLEPERVVSRVNSACRLGDSM